MSYTPHIQKGILLNANESSLNVCDEIMDEICENLRSVSFNRYPDSYCTDLRKAYGNVMHIDHEHILCGNGSDQMLGFMIQYYLHEKSKLYTLDPDFSMYDYYVEMQGASMVKFETNEDGSFDVDAFIDYGLRQNVDMVMFSNPNNPTGHAIGLEDMEKIASSFKTIPVIFDEAYMEFGEKSALSLYEAYPNVYVSRTLSKAYGLAGIRCGFLVGTNVVSLRDAFVPYALNSVTQMIASTVLEHASAYQDRIACIRSERERMYAILKNYTSCKFYPSHANFIYGYCEDIDRLKQCFDDQGVMLRWFKGKKNFRITVASCEENDLVLNILKEFEED